MGKVGRGIVCWRIAPTKAKNLHSGSGCLGRRGMVMNLPNLLTSETAIWVALITGAVVLIGYYMTHRFTQIREKERFEREMA